MPIPTTIESLSTTAASNGPAGSEDRSTADDGLRQAYAFIKQSVSLGSNIASASSITPPSTGSVFNITGTTTITAIGSTNSWDGRIVTFIFAGALTLTHSATLPLPGSINITTAANDVATFVQTASGTWRCVAYERSNGGALLNGNVTIAAPSSGDTLTVAAGGEGLVLGGNLRMNDSTSQLNSYATVATEIVGRSNAPMTFYTNNALRMTIAAAGNVTIAAPSSGLTLVLDNTTGGAAAVNDVARVYTASSSTATPRLLFGSLANTDAGAIGVNTSAADAGEMIFYTDRAGTLTEFMRGASTGKVTIALPSAGYAFNLPQQTPASAAAAGTLGDIAVDANYVYVCTATNTWKRAALTTW